MATELEERKKKSIFNSIIKSSKTNVEPVRKLHLLNSKGQTHPTVQVGLSKQTKEKEKSVSSPDQVATSWLNGKRKNTNKKPQSRNKLEDTFWHIQMMRFSLAYGTPTSYEKLKSCFFTGSQISINFLTESALQESLWLLCFVDVFLLQVTTMGSPWDPDHINLSALSKRYQQRQDIKEERKEILLISTLEIKTWSKARLSEPFLFTQEVCI